MKIPTLPGLTLTLVSSLAIVILLTMPGLAISSTDTNQRVLTLRERASVGLLDDTFSLELLKIRGYMIDIRVQGEKQKLKRGDSLSPQGSECTVTFQKVSPETRIARFLTDCS